jgi:pimeloyl-ACP methyl ester carboxylesterase
MTVSRLLAALLCTLCAARASVAQDQTPAKPAEPAVKPETKPEAAPVPEKPVPKTTPIAHVETRGTGPIPMVLVPALVCDWHMYDAFMLRNGQRFTMYAVTLPGFGTSRPPPAPLEGQSYALTPWLDNAEQAILKLVEEKKLDKPILMGVSTGGHIALRTAIRSPDSFRSLIIINGLPAIQLRGAAVLTPAQRADMVDQQFAKELGSLTDEVWAASQTKWIKDNFPDPDHAREVLAAAATVPKSTSGRYMLEYFASDVNDRLSALKMPLLAVSSIPPAENSESQGFRDSWIATYAKLAQAKLAYFEGGTEFLTEDSPLELDKAIEQFIDGKAVDGKATDVTKRLPSKTSGVQPAPAQVTPAKPPEPK